VADPELALDLLRHQVEAGHAGEPLFSGGEPVGARFPALTIGETVQDEGVLRGTERARHGVDSGIRVLRDEVGLGQQDIVRLPVLFRTSEANLPGDPVAALLPDVVNLINTGRPLVLTPRQHAPTVNGNDVFETVIEERLGSIGVAVHWVEDFGYAHPGGEVHCATNAVRDVGALDPWWLEGPVVDGEG
jgi:protein-arginine deiminase